MKTVWLIFSDPHLNEDKQTYLGVIKILRSQLSISSVISKSLEPTCNVVGLE